VDAETGLAGAAVAVSSMAAAEIASVRRAAAAALMDQAGHY
jgi:hypothetical protein